MRIPHSLALPILWLTAGSAILAEPGGEISFTQALTVILSGNAGLQSAAIDTLAAKKNIDVARALPNPSVGIALEQFGANEIEASIEQTVELGRKRQVRTDAARNELENTRNEYKSARLELEIEAVRRFVPVVAGIQNLSLLDSITAIAKNSRDQIEKRVAEGAGRKTDLLRAEIDIEQLELERGELTRRIDAARKKFAALGSSRDSVLLSVHGDFADETPVPTLDEFLSAIHAHPRIKAAHIERESHVIARRQLRSDAVSDITLSAGYLRNNIDKENSALVGVSMEVPIFSRTAAARTTVDLRAQASGERAAGVVRLLEADVQDLYSGLRTAENKISILVTSAIPKAQQVHALVAEYFAGGSAGYLDLAQAQSDLYRLHADLLDTREIRAQYLAELMQISSLRMHIVK